MGKSQISVFIGTWNMGKSDLCVYRHLEYG